MKNTNHRRFWKLSVFATVLWMVGPISEIQAELALHFTDDGAITTVASSGSVDLTGWTFDNVDGPTTTDSFFDTNTGDFESFGSASGSDWVFDRYTNPMGAAVLDVSTGSIFASASPLTGAGGILVAGNFLYIDGVDDDLRTGFIGVGTRTYTGTVLDLLGDDDFNVTATFPSADGGTTPGQVIRFTTTAVPEPSSFVLGGLLTLAGLRRRRRS